MMDFEAALSFVRTEIDKALRGRLPVPPGYLDAHVRERSGIAGLLEETMRDRLVRHLETIYGTQQEDGHVLRSEFQEWLPERMATIDFHFWRRLQKFWMDYSVLPVAVVRSVDTVTNEILGYLGDPHDETSWQRRGLVMGHVQSGKTTNYSALVAKAADAGYRIIIVLAGLTNSLRYQTQVRLDMTFVGKSSLGDLITPVIYPVATVFKGIDGEDQAIRHPFCGTTQNADFNINIARGIGATEGNFRDPILFVTKKHDAVLARLAEWLRNLRQGSPLEGPMLLIDDEADNASVNTQRDPDRTTRINSRIRELLRCSRRYSYVGYTATPFANIFIDPDSQDQMLGDDLFPKHFIKSLDPPDNYIGSDVLFADGGSLAATCIREIPDDYQDLLPLKHKSDHDVAELPESLLDAVREYVLFRALRLLSDAGAVNSSMLINVSRFNNVQQQIHDELYRFISSLREAVEVWSASPSWHQSKALCALHRVWQAEYAGSGKHEWEQVLGTLRRAAAPIELRLVNMRGDGLDYSRTRDTGVHVIAIGGLALARGLTLEGLAISYVLRNVRAADTLMQMGRWFGYKPGYADLCRIHATGEMIEDFREISEAIEELRDDLVRMERMGRTPNDFGLKVRQSPTGIAITAANKMRTAKPYLLAVDLSQRHLQGFEVRNRAETNVANIEAANAMVSTLQSDAAVKRVEDAQAVVWTGVGVGHIQTLLRDFELPQLDFARVDDNRSLVLDYINDRAKRELATWDIAIPHTKGSGGGNRRLPLPFTGLEEFFCRRRLSGVPREDGSDIVKFTEKNVVADPAPTDVRYGEDVRGLDERAEALKCENDRWSVEKCYVTARRRPLLVIHAVQFELRDKSSEAVKLAFPPDQSVVTLSLAFPETSTPAREKEYAASRRLLEMLRRAREETESDEDVDDDE